MSKSDETLDGLRRLAGAGAHFVPIPPRSKNPGGKGWQQQRHDWPTIEAHLRQGGNAGLLLINGWTDIDLDCPEAIALADEFLPPTDCIFGRTSARRAHRLYRSDPAATYEKYVDPVKRGEKVATILEVRAAAPDKGLQTVIPGSTHPDGEPITFDADGEPAGVDGTALMRAAADLAAACLLARHWPAKGTRHDAALAAAGFLLRGGLDEPGTVRIVCQAARLAGDEEWRERRKDVESTAAELRLRRPVTGGPTLADLVGAKILDAVSKWLQLRREGSSSSAARMSTTEGDHGEIERTASRRHVAEQLVEIVTAADVELFHDSDGTAFATIEIDGHQETYALRSRDFRSWVERAYYAATRQAPSRLAFDSALGVLTGRARYDGEAHSVCTRLGEHEGRIYLDLGDTERRVVEIDPEGWRLVAQSPVRFRRTRGILPLPVPVGGGSITELRPFVNVASDADFALIVAWLFAALRPRGPYPVLTLHGEQGSAKSTTAKALRAAIDPNSAALRATPRDTRDLMIAATNGVIIGIDNLSHLTPAISDALCCLATGGGFATRQLHTDAEEIIFSATRPVLLNGIEEIATRGDLLDRAIVIELPTIPEDRRRSEADVWAKYESARPRILGALLDAVAGALRELPHTHLARLPRMADFAIWTTAAEPTLGWKPGTFMAAYLANRGGAHELTIEASLVGRTLRRFLDDRDAWTGTASNLLAALAGLLDNDQRQDRAWPRSPRGLTGAIRRVAPSLRAVGITIDHDRQPGGDRTRTITLTRRASDRPDRPNRPKPSQDGHDRGTVGDDRGTDAGRSGRGATPTSTGPRDDWDGRDDWNPDVATEVEI